MAGYSGVSRSRANSTNSHHSSAHSATQQLLHSSTTNISSSKHPNYPQLSRKFVARRISEGETGRLKEELKCQACGKGYKHVSSLAKHLWEHTPEWNVTSKLLISKHQQVQLLEAASILVSMNDEENNDEEESEDGSASGSTPPTEANSRNVSKELNESEASSRAESLVSERGKSNSAEPSAVQAASSTAKPLVIPTDAESAVDMGELTPARDIPILSAKPISKTPSRYSHRRMSTNAGSLGSLGSLGRQDNLMLRQASPLPESILAKDYAHHPPHRRRRQSVLPTSGVPRETSLELDEDGLQDPQESPDNDGPHTPKQSPKESPKKNVTPNDDVFGLEV